MADEPEIIDVEIELDASGFQSAVNHLLAKMDENHHIEITAYVVDGPNSWTRPESTPDREVIGGIRTADASKWKYRKIIDAYTDLLKMQLTKAMEDAGVLE